MSKMGRKITALMLALLMATSTCSVGLAAQEQVGSIGTAVSASAGDTVTVTFDSQGGSELAPIETTAGSTVGLVYGAEWRGQPVLHRYPGDGEPHRVCLLGGNPDRPHR